jgi:hypothetical protein
MSENQIESEKERQATALLLPFSLYRTSPKSMSLRAAALAFWRRGNPILTGKCR